MLGACFSSVSCFAFFANPCVFLHKCEPELWAMLLHVYCITRTKVYVFACTSGFQVRKFFRIVETHRKGCVNRNEPATGFYRNKSLLLFFQTRNNFVKRKTLNVYCLTRCCTTEVTWTRVLFVNRSASQLPPQFWATSSAFLTFSGQYRRTSTR